MRVKICGLREPANIDHVLDLQPDYIGMVFYEGSKRNARGVALPIQLQNVGSTTGKVGVFVNAPLKEVVETVQSYFLTHVQLHGDEDVEYLRVLDKNLPGIQVIKAFRVDPAFDFSQVAPYAGLVSHVLFDTPSVGYGGSGKVFDWSLLDGYTSGPTFFLSGGLNPENVREATTYVRNHALGFGLDASSGLELSPGVKSISLVTRFLKEART